MLEKLVLDQETAKEDYKARLPALQVQLFDLERRARATRIPTIIVFEGLEGAGKGATIRALTERLDPRALRIHPVQDPRPHELDRPWMWRFWMKLPNDGEIAIFDTSWYRHVLQERLAGNVKRREWEEAFHEINEFEHQLADDGAVLVKFWLHIAEKEQRRRFKRAEKDPTASLRVTKQMWKQNEDYAKWTKAIEQMLERTESEWAPWTIIESHDRRSARLKVFRTVIAALSGRLAKTPGAPPPLPYVLAAPPRSAEAAAPAPTPPEPAPKPAEPAAKQAPAKPPEPAAKQVPAKPPEPAAPAAPPPPRMVSVPPSSPALSPASAIAGSKKEGR